ncbi:3-oxoacyl-ACP synthase III family protein [Mesoaciditoga lauensis]|uniref:3-oxoacyl-ACP synthase III family protein n=1 Tax=Mesoaciditoga lauensis TaxID=1495039 RepID=UPI00056622A2|nr:beta-ketoacyl-ACP synthase 3 [Mesoaciditoga lauensis]
MRFSKIIGIGGYLPPKVIENTEFETDSKLEKGWIFRRTGIKRRHIAEESAVDMGIKALREAANDAKISLDEIEYIFVVTNSADTLIPGMAGRIQSVFNKPIGGVDVQAGCSGFIQTMEIADSMIKAGTFSKIAVIGTEKLSTIVDWNDPYVSSLFGDGAAAVIMGKSDEAGIISSYSRIQEEGWETLIQKRNGYLQMDGKAVFRFAVSAIEEGINEVLKRAKMDLSQVDLIIPHQSNARIISRVSKETGIPKDKFQISIAEHANTAAASVALALKDAIKSNKIGPSSVVLTVAYGAGLALASNVFKL